MSYPSRTQTPTWCSRSTLAEALGKSWRATGLLVTSPDGDVVAPLAGPDLDQARDITRRTLTSLGVQRDDRVVVSLNNDGELTGTLLAEAAADCAEAAVSIGPRGRMRQVAVIESIRANVLITTACGAKDLLARLHMEFLADPLDLELRMLVLVGEIADDATFRHLGREYGAEVVEAFCDPVLGIALAHRRPLSDDPTWQETVEDVLALSDLDEDATLQPHDGASGPCELVVNHHWHSKLAGVVLRTGYVCRLEEWSNGIPGIRHTVGDQVIIRGRWVRLAGLKKALKDIDGITALRLEIDRQGTLDTASLRVSFGRETLLNNPMWRGRIEQALAAFTPIHIDVVIEGDIVETATPLEIRDLRGHHLARDVVTS